MSERVLALNEKGEFTVIRSDEDVHTKGENHLTEKLGELGRKFIRAEAE